MKIVIANTEKDKRKIFEFRFKIYIEELDKTFLLNKSNSKLLFDDLDDKAVNVFAEIDNKIVACLRCKVQKMDQRLCNKFGDFGGSITSDTVFAQIDRFMVSPKYRGTNVALQMMVWIYKYGLENRVDIALVEVEKALVKLYEGCGFIPFRKSHVSGKSDEKRTQLSLKLRDRNNLKSSNSFFLQVLDGHLEKEYMMAD